MDLDRAGRRQDPAAHAHDAEEGVQAPDRRHDPVYTDLDRTKVEVRRIHKMGRNAVDSNAVFIDDLFRAGRGPIGERARASSTSSTASTPSASCGERGDRRRSRRAAAGGDLSRSGSCSAARSGRTRASSIPLAESWTYLESAYWMVCAPAGSTITAALAARGQRGEVPGRRAAFDAATRAVMTHGGMGYAREYQVERFFGIAS